jgi:hypothetical protein
MREEDGLTSIWLTQWMALSIDAREWKALSLA